jgi:hypothetical protein
MSKNRKVSNKPARSQKNYRSMAGNLKYSWKPFPFNKRGGVKPGVRVPDCDNTNSIDNVVTYVYEILPDGNHSSYVECDYVD